MERSATPVEEMIQSLDDGVRPDIQALDGVIAEEMKGLSRVLWEGKMWGGTDQRIIGYGDFNTRNSKGKQVDWFMIGLAAQKNYLSVYVNAVEDGVYIADKFADRLGKIKRGASSVSFKKVSDIDIEVFRELVASARQVMTKAD